MKKLIPNTIVPFVLLATHLEFPEGGPSPSPMHCE